MYIACVFEREREMENVCKVEVQVERESVCRK